MKSKNIDDILNEMRNRADTVIEGRAITERNFVPQEKIDEWAAQIELAVKHMHGLAQAHCNMLAKAVKYHKDKHIGNAAAMCEALKMFVDAYETTSYSLCLVNLRPAFQKAKTALAKSPRNCDVGTAEEQRRRYDEWRNHDELRAEFGKDEFEWAQMPYEANEKGGADDSNG